MDALIHTIHANMLVIDGIGVLVRGAPNSGKSELSLALLERGHQLVSDDAVDFFCKENTLIAKCPLAIKGFMQINYIGAINIEKLYGPMALCDSHQIDVCIYLCEKDNIQTLPQPLMPIEKPCIFLGISLPEFQLPCNHPSPALLLETLVRNYKLKNLGYNSHEDFIARNALCNKNN